MSAAENLTRRLGGNWCGHYGLVPAPGHSARDRSVKVWNREGGGILVHSYAGEDWRAIKDQWKSEGLIDAGTPHSARFQTPKPCTPRKAKPKPPPNVLPRLWQRTSVVTTDCPAGRYLIGRGCALPDPDGDLRWLPDLEHRHTRTSWPALVGHIADAVTGAPMSLHFTFLAPTGTGKAPVEPQRLCLAGHPKKGGVVRLWPDAEVTLGLAIGEGIETCLSAAHGFTPVWAALDAGNVANFPVLDGIDSLTVLADDDKAGEAAAEQVLERWTAAGREVRIWRRF